MHEIPDSSLHNEVDGFGEHVVADIFAAAQAEEERQRQAALDEEYRKLRRWAKIQALWQFVWPVIFFIGLIVAFAT